MRHDPHQRPVHNLPLSRSLAPAIHLAREGFAVDERSPVRIDYRNATLMTAPAPSSGGMALAQMFGMLEQRPVPADAERVRRVHWLAIIRPTYRSWMRQATLSLQP